MGSERGGGGGGMEKNSKQITWCFTPSQPLRLYHGEMGERTSLNATTL